MAAAIKFQQHAENMAKGVIDFTSSASSGVTVFLTNEANPPSASADAVLGDVTESNYSNLSTRVVAGVTAEHTTGTVDFTATNLVLTASGTVAAFRYIGLYADVPTSPADPLIEYWDYGSDLVLNNNDALTLNFTTGNFAVLS